MSNPMIVAGQKKKKWPKPTNMLIGSGSFRVVFSGRLYFSSFWRWTISVSSKLEGPNPLQTFLPHFPGKVTVKQVRVFYFKKLSVRQQAGSCALCLNSTGIRFFFPCSRLYTTIYLPLLLVPSTAAARKFSPGHLHTMNSPVPFSLRFEAARSFFNSPRYGSFLYTCVCVSSFFFFLSF